MFLLYLIHQTISICSTGINEIFLCEGDKNILTGFANNSNFSQTTLKISKDVIKIDFSNNSTQLTNVSDLTFEVDSHLKEISNAFLFNSLPKLKRVKFFPRSIKIIPDGAFNGLSQLSTLIPVGSEFDLGLLLIHSNIIKIGEKAFSRSAIIQVIFERNSHLLSIGKNAFSFCTKLIQVDDIPSQITEIPDWLFGFCSSLTTVFFSNHPLLNKTIVIGSNVEEIGIGAFSFIVTDKIHFAENSKLQNIGEKAFTHCSKLVEVSGYPLKYIPSYAFADCPNIKNFTSGDAKIEKGIYLGNINYIRRGAFHTVTKNSFECIYKFNQNQLDYQSENEYFTQVLEKQIWCEEQPQKQENL